MAYEIWLFCREPEYKVNGYLMAVESVPPSYSRGDAEELAEKREHDHMQDFGLFVTTVLREEPAY